MTEMVASGLMRGCWRRSDGPLEGDTRPKGEKRPGLARPVRHRASALLHYLAVNGYRTADADGLLDILSGRRPPLENTIALTLDDGRGSLWATAYPILRKYGLQ